MQTNTLYSLFFKLFVVLVCTLPLTLNAQKIGAHIGVVQPIVTFSNTGITTLADNYAIGFPIGLTYKVKDNLAFDAEFVPFIHENGSVHLLVHPGVLIGLGKGFTFGARAAFEIGRNSYGVTPLINKAFPISEKSNFFIELVFPFRITHAVLSNDINAGVTVALHVGVAF